MNWEDIELKAKHIVRRIMAQLAETDEQEADRLKGGEKEAQDLVKELLEPGLLLHERARREKYDYRYAYKRLLQDKKRRMIRWIGVAAAGIVFILGGIGFYLNAKFDTKVPEIAKLESNRHQVVLVLSNGESVILDGKDTLQLKEGNKAIRVENGRIAYQGSGGSSGEPQVRYNHLSVPRGAEYQIELADGTKVHLNADSELRYPVVFAADRREVELRGEAWFEVAKEAELPFYVLADGVRIRVYGTAFNVNTHHLQSVQTVLVEGSIGIKAGEKGEELRMYPGQLAEYNRACKEIRLREVDVRQYIAWRDGIFYFSDETLEDILNKLVRWYDMEVFFQSNRVKELHFTGHLARYEDIRKILDTVTESTGVIFEIKDKTIIVK